MKTLLAGVASSVVSTVCPGYFGCFGLPPPLLPMGARKDFSALGAAREPSMRVPSPHPSTGMLAIRRFMPLGRGDVARGSGPRLRTVMSTG